MRNIKEIKELEIWLRDFYHQKRLVEQEIDDKYHRDTFDVPYIKDPYKIIRVGTGRELVDVPASHIVTSHPQVYVEATDNNKVALERARKRGSLLNHWADYLVKQNPQPYKDFVKKMLKRGEAWIHVVNNDSFNEDVLFQDDIPIIFATPDPLIVFGSPDERNGVPDYVIVSYLLHWQTILSRYEHWTNPMNRGLHDNDTDVNWMEYWDGKTRYFEADGEPVLPKTDDFDWGGLQPNILGFTPFVHAYSGYGDKTATGAPEDLAVSRIRPVRGKMLEETEVTSAIASQLKIFAAGRIKLTPSAEEYTKAAEEYEYDLSPGAKNVIPFGITAEYDMGEAPGPAVFAHLGQIKADIQRSNPPVMLGMGTGTSGRQEDIQTKHALAQYENVIDNSSTAWAMAFSLGLRIIKDKNFNLLPMSVRTLSMKKGQRIRENITIKEEDIDDFSCVLKLKAADPIEDKAQAQIGMMMQDKGVIDWETNLTDFQGKSLDEAREIIDKTMAEQFIQNNPDLMKAMGAAAMVKLGIEVPTPTATGEVTGALGGAAGAGSRGGPPRTGNIQSVVALAQDADMQVAPRPPRNASGLGR